MSYLLLSTGWNTASGGYGRLHRPSGWPPSDLSERIVHLAREVIASSISMTCSLLGITGSKLKLPRPRASRVITWRPVDALTARSQ